MSKKITQKENGGTSNIELSKTTKKFSQIIPNRNSPVQYTSHLPFQTLYLNLLSILRAVFLPEGYPKTVSKDYLEYQIWDSLQALCSTLTGTLSTHAILKGVGMGDDATAAAASVRWLIRDGSGMIGRILFAWWQGTNLDANSKTFRLVADILNDVAILLEILSPAFPDYFLLLICIGNLMKAIVGVAGGATRASFTEHQARSNNMADVSAKDGSQETALGLVGLILGVIFIPLIAQSPMLIWICYSIFTFFHIYCNYRSVIVLEMDSINQQRLHIVTWHFLQQINSSSNNNNNNNNNNKNNNNNNKSKGKGNDQKDKSSLITPRDCAKLERIFSREILLGYNNPSLVLGAHFVDLIEDEAELEYYQELYPENCGYFLGISKRKRNEISTVLMEHSEDIDQIRAFFQYVFIRYEVNEKKKSLDRTLIERSIDFCSEHFDRFYKSLSECGWDVHKTLLSPTSIRVDLSS